MSKNASTAGYTSNHSGGGSGGGGESDRLLFPNDDVIRTRTRRHVACGL